MMEALRAACVLEEVLALPDGLDAKIGERGHGFSEGQAQRVSIARALLCDAPVFLLDEATSALDVATERQVLRGVMKKDGRRTIIVATHRPSVLDLCTRVYRVAEGRVVLMDEGERRRMMEAF